MAAEEQYGGVLGTYVHLDGRAYGPADGELPLAVASRITNPKVWAEKPRGLGHGDPAAAPADPLEAIAAELTRLRAAEADRQRDTVRDSGVGVPDTVPAADPPAPTVTVDVVQPPPMRGAGSAAVDWAAYADRMGVELAEGDRTSRDKIVEAVRAAGKPVDRT